MRLFSFYSDFNFSSLCFDGFGQGEAQFQELVKESEILLCVGLLPIELMGAFIAIKPKGVWTCLIKVDTTSLLSH